MLTTMRFADELRSPRDLELPDGVGATRERSLAVQLVEALAADWRPDQYHDTYRDTLRASIKRRREGKDVVIPETPARPKVTDLMEALRTSLEQPPRDLARAAGRRARPAAARRRRAAGSRQAA